MSKSVSAKERFFWIGLIALLLVVSGGRIQHLERQSTLARRHLAQHRQEQLQDDLARLQEQRQNARDNTLNVEEECALRAKGLMDPVADIAADLQKHPELIPFKGVLGGTMGFYSVEGIEVLSSRWVLADFDDGHVLGKALLQYQVCVGGQISWKLMDAYIVQ